MSLKFIVGWDGSTAAAAAADWCARFARGDEVRLVHVTDNGSDATTFVAGSETAAARIRLMDDADRVRRGHPDLVVTSELIEGNVVERLTALTGRDTLVVVGSAKREPGQHASRWSVGTRIAASAHGAVAVIPEGHDAAAAGVVAGFDRSDASRRALDVAATLADRVNLPLRLVCVWQKPLPARGAPLLSGKYLETVEAMYLPFLDEAKEEVSKRHPRLAIETELISGDTVGVLQNASRLAGLIVVGSHGYHGITRMLLGSVSHSLLLGLSGPTVVVGRESSADAIDDIR